MPLKYAKKINAARSGKARAALPAVFSINARAVEGLRIGGADALSGQCELGIVQAQCESVVVTHDKCDGRFRRGAYCEAPVILFQEALGCFSESFDHQASIFVEDAVGSAVLRE
jgi:hypothetical protein